ncbi:immunoglobulin alpha Fc receptor isoform X3 [Sagmatias obliquidens]|uniref:immunoglobulin alpha Fc receptor isoform X3 n=1 Tax=Sagmatias obliquidens TaxID=3371155 RepID=UPI000F4418C2|nr:immunoglobulin alpha Fc receptor isoform X3 [Lagenorhynchus obliquidens]
MTPRDTTLFCLVLCLGQKIQAQDGNLPIPTISAMPGSVIPWNESVKILCGGTPESFLYQLEILGNSTYKVVEKILGFQKTAEFVIKRMDTNTAGRYQCRYRKQYSWSVHSEALELVVTDTTNQDYTTENLIRMGVAGLPLVVLLVILAENWLGHQVPHKEDQQELPELSCSRQKTQTEWTFGLTPKGHQVDTRH